jgi:hypothetical protein
VHLRAARVHVFPVHTPHTTLGARVWLTTTDLAVTAGKDEEGEGRVEAANVLLVHLLHCNHLLSIFALQVCVCVCVHDAHIWATQEEERRSGRSLPRVQLGCALR